MIYDVAIIGAGPAGMSAAVRLGRIGVSVLVVDEQPAPGGQIWRGIERNSANGLSDDLGADYQQGDSVVSSFRNAPVDYRPETQVWQIEDGFRLFLTSKGRSELIKSRAVLVATGAQERPIPFPGWTLPGVMTVGAAQVLLKSGGMLPDSPIWIAGCGPLSLLYATQALGLGAQIGGYLDTADATYRSIIARLPMAAMRDFNSLRKGLTWSRQIRRSGCRIVRGARSLRAVGGDHIAGVSWTCGEKTEHVETNLLLVHDGVIPRIHTTLALGCAHDWNATQNCLIPRSNRWLETSRPGIFVAGDGHGIGGWKAARISGEIAALGVANHLRVNIDAEGQRRKDHLDAKWNKALALRSLLDAVYPPQRAILPDETIVCRCEEVTAGVIRDAASESAPNPNAVKAVTRAGMGPCQGRQCGYTVKSLISEVHGIEPADIGFFNVRPPLKPVTIGEVSSLSGLGDVT